jgi:hypothetical protein
MRLHESKYAFLSDLSLIVDIALAQTSLLYDCALNSGIIAYDDPNIRICELLGLANLLV